jgi:acylphosphatase
MALGCATVRLPDNRCRDLNETDFSAVNLEKHGMKRMHLYISGKVQGVAFRHYTAKKARSLNLAGWVRNLDDGRVETVFEGADNAVDAMLSWCRQGPSLARVTRVDANEEPIPRPYPDFRITF